MTANKLKKILSDHKLWIEAGYQEGKRAILSGADLRRADLRGVYLTDASLSCASLSGTDLRGTEFGGAYLRNTDLRNADLRGANLTETDLSYSDLTGAIFTLEIKNVGWFKGTTFSEEAIPWLILNPRYSEFADTLTFV